MVPKEAHFINVCMIPFQIRTTEISNAETRAVLDEVQQGKNLVGGKDTGILMKALDDQTFDSGCLVPVARRLKKR